MPDRTAAQALLADRVSGRAATVTAVVRVLAGAFLVLAAAPKFVLHDLELAAFVGFGLPASSLLVYLVGAAEAVAGVLLVLGVLTRPAALAMALTMAGAVLTAGVQVGGPFHLGVAPALLAVMLYLLWAGGGSPALDRRLLSARH